MIDHSICRMYSSGHKKVPVPFLFNANANSKRTLNARCTNGECFKNGRWMHAKRTMNARETELLNTISNVNATERKRTQMPQKANATEHKRIGTQMQRNANAMERKRNATQKFLQCKRNGTQTAFNANGTGTFLWPLLYFLNQLGKSWIRPTQQPIILSLHLQWQLESSIGSPKESRSYMIWGALSQQLSSI